MRAEQRLAGDVIAFWTAEADRIHELCDRVLVPREVNGQKLSMSQRVEVMEGVLQSMRMKLIDTVGGMQ